MPGPNRINIGGLMCSCVAHGAIMAGLFLSGWNAPARAPARRESRGPMVLRLIPLKAVGEPRGIAARPSSPARQLPAFGTGATRARPVTATEPARPASMATAESSSPSAPIASGAAAPVSGAPLNDYQRRLYEIVARNCRYPDAARRLRAAGITHLAFRLDRLGNVLDSWVQESSGSEALDDAALDALRRSQPLPPIPPALPPRMEFVIEIDSSAVPQFAPPSGS